MNEESIAPTHECIYLNCWCAVIEQLERFQLQYVVVNRDWEALATRDSFEECEIWTQENPTDAHGIAVRRTYR